MRNTILILTVLTACMMQSTYASRPSTANATQALATLEAKSRMLYGYETQYYQRENLRTTYVPYGRQLFYERENYRTSPSDQYRGGDYGYGRRLNRYGRRSYRTQSDEYKGSDETYQKQEERKKKRAERRAARQERKKKKR